MHSLTLECFKSERGCWQTAKHLVSKWSLWPPFSATLSGWNKPLLIWTGIMYGQSSKVSLHRAHVTKINIEIEADVTLGYRWRNGSRSVEVWRQEVKFATLCKVCALTTMIAFHRLCYLPSAFWLERSLPLIAEFLSLMLVIRKELGVMCSCLKPEVTPAGDDQSVAHQVIVKMTRTDDISPIFMHFLNQIIQC